MDTLDEQTPEVQPEVFRQGMEPEAAPVEDAPPATPEPEPSEPPVAPSWLDERPPVREPERDEPRYAPPQYAPQQYPQYAQQQPPAPHTKRGLDAFIDDPDGYINSLVESRLEQRINQAIGPLAYQQQMIAGMTNQMREAQFRSVKGQADASIKKAYDAFNKDKTFRTNKNVQRRIEGTLKGLYAQAVEAAQYGDLSQLYNLANMNESHVRATIAAARAIEGDVSYGSAPMQVEGAFVESSRSPAAAGGGPELTAEEQEIARRLGGNYADRLRKAKAEAAKYNDFELD